MNYQTIEKPDKTASKNYFGNTMMTSDSIVLKARFNL